MKVLSSKLGSYMINLDILVHVVGVLISYIGVEVL